MRPNPTLQRRQAHRQRLALGRAMYQVRYVRKFAMPPWRRLPVPKLLRKHARLLRRAFAVLGS